ncbi:PWI domain-containing protein [Xylariales sp. AK1849]|nr:PWI domain-containing protein [Xylariales sp. AK1849]
MAATVDMKLLRATKFPPEFNQKVDMQKVNLEVMKKWIAGKISEILGSEDDVVTELCFNLIEGSRFPDIKSMQIQLTGFLDKETAPFCKELWMLFLSAQASPQGVPKELLEAKKLELIQEKLEVEKAAEEARMRRETQERRDRELTDVRHRERRDRGSRGGRGDNWRGVVGSEVAEIDLSRLRKELLIGVGAIVIVMYHKTAGLLVVVVRLHGLSRQTHEALYPNPVPVRVLVVLGPIAAGDLAGPMAHVVVAPHADHPLVTEAPASARDPGHGRIITDLAKPATEILLRRTVPQTRMTADAHPYPKDEDTRIP